MVIAPSVVHASTTARPRDGVIHIRSIWLDETDAVYERYHQFLSADERARAARFVFERDRRRFVVCRGSLRAALGEYLEIDPGAVTFAYGRRGKPTLLKDRGVAFNVSHSAGLALFAFARTGPIGVDVESLERSVDAEALATRFFSADEVRDLMSVPPGQRPEAFLNGWTRKEAYIKAVGDGLAVPLDRFSVSLLPSAPAAMRWIGTGDSRDWRIGALHPAPRFVAAVATPWAPSALECAFAGDPQPGPLVRTCVEARHES